MAIFLIALSPFIIVFEWLMLGCLSIYLSLKRSHNPFFIDVFWGLLSAVGLYLSVFLINLAVQRFG